MFDPVCGSYSRTRILNEEKSFVKGVTEGANFRRRQGGSPLSNKMCVYCSFPKKRGMVMC